MTPPPDKSAPREWTIITSDEHSLIDTAVRDEKEIHRYKCPTNDAIPVVELSALQASQAEVTELKGQLLIKTAENLEVLNKFLDLSPQLRALEYKLKLAVEQRNIWVRCPDDELSSVQQKRSNETIAKLDLEVQAAGKDIK